MRRGSLVIITFLILHLLGSHASGEEYEPRDGTSPPGIWEWVKGRRAGDALFLGMWSLHLDSTGAFGNRSNNENNKLLGVQFYGANAGTFVNSHWDTSYFFGLSRTVYTKGFSKATHMDVGYKVGVLYGYGNDFPNIWGFCPLILPTVGFTYKRLGIEIGVIGVRVLTASFRIDIEKILPPGSRNRRRMPVHTWQARSEDRRDSGETLTSDWK